MNRAEDSSARRTIVVEPGTLGYLIQEARRSYGYSFRALAQKSGVAQSQISKLEHNQVQRPNAGHLAALAEPLGLTVYQLYAAAGYRTAVSLTALTPELEHALAGLPPHALSKVEHYVNQLQAEHNNDQPGFSLEEQLGN